MYIGSLTIICMKFKQQSVGIFDEKLYSLNWIIPYGNHIPINSYIIHQLNQIFDD